MISSATTTTTAALRILYGLLVLFLPTTVVFGWDCEYDLSLPGSGQGAATARINHDKLEVEFWGAVPNTVYTVWVDFRNRTALALGDDDNLYPGDYPFGTPQGSGNGRGVAPAFAKIDPVYAGMQLDKNAVKTDGNGNAWFSVDLDYNLLGISTSPVVAETLTLQNNGNRIGGEWMRVYELDGELSSQKTSPNTGIPELVLATAQGLTIVGHFRPYTHGHTPGVGGVDHFPGFFGDFPPICRTNAGASASSDLCDNCPRQQFKGVIAGVQCCIGEQRCKQHSLDLGVYSLCCKGKQACEQINENNPQGTANNAHKTLIACIGEQTCKQADFSNYGQIDYFCDGEQACEQIIT